MNIGKIISYGSVVFFILIVSFVAVIGLAVSAGASENQGETITNTETSTDGGSFAVGTVSNEIPPLLAGVFREVSGKTGVPVSLIAAISYQECNLLWTHAQKHPDIVEIWITRNIDVDAARCGTPRSDSGASGPMQFIPGTWAEYRGRAGDLSGHKPASVNNVRDSIFAGALLMRNGSRILADLKKQERSPDSLQESDWKEYHIERASIAYFGDSEAYVDGKLVKYSDSIIRRWKQYGGGQQ